jgi:Flp pilus assembly protein TadG
MLLGNASRHCVSSRHPARSERKATASVELAILLPFLVPLLLGIWEVGRLIEVDQIMENAVREGGRQISTGNKTSAEIKTVVINYLKHNGIDAKPEDITIVNLTSSARPDPTQAEQMDEYQITLTVPFNSVRWILLDQITDVTDLYASANWYSMKDIPINVNDVIPLE